MIQYTTEIIEMMKKGWRPSSSRCEWIDTHFQNTAQQIWGAALGCTTMNSNQRFIVIEL